MREKSSVGAGAAFCVFELYECLRHEFRQNYKETEPSPTTNYGKSKLEAENDLNILANQFPNTFTVAILRPPMIYGKGCKGNYNALKRLH